ncbi:hypothetical protein D9613_002491 [Agrocybe pediades]|uniref:Large ribosomal subunit protein mL54 n=1 Tax=Agrocybe pediades TaxID=84607 RepID=A0A8H4VKS2_9AGAR|nr:hypothetical protein D9613_002491 [Agrocybe pediades]
MTFLQCLRRVQLTSSRQSSWLCARSYSTPAPAAAAPKAPKKAATNAPQAAAIPQSSCPADTVLKGINYLKGQAPVVAQADDAYPEWLWTILKPKVYEDDGPGGKKERVERRKANRQAIKDRNFMQTQ